MGTKARLTDVIEGMEFQADESRVLFDKRTGKVVRLMDEEVRAAEDEEPIEDFPDWQHDGIRLAREMRDEEESFVALPSQFDIHEYSIMERFCLSLQNEETSGALCDAIRGGGAFRRFKDGVHRFGISDQWDEYRYQALKEIAIEWCESEKIPYIDDCPPALKLKQPPNAQKTGLYEELASQLRELLGGERDFIANAANLSALVFGALPEVNWVGVYRFQDGELLLGPFQGKPACTRIPPGKGVCGTAARMLETVVVENVHEFPGHIACDGASNSEIVVPIVKDGRLIGVLDLDSPAFGRFDDEDQAGLEKLVAVFVASTDVAGKATGP